ncbi:hypothetical protein PBT90_19220 [Algoriphagus halophytocola]|uniref:Lipoprotein n=1 Tax=Algoriphagus halophytocola TaxID=2991499 RepID=A0ABY6MD48_9BACT|nr:MULTISPECIES: hypothetical protein [unclassified Algoriphagus]UZD21647.1 hypothetical protein OM944_13355 [Algoriphagus sp. TR-M5]WBL42859.1 hypothetical protein PBT90_19220 [Algoriphagus sp. TR-M9]
MSRVLLPILLLSVILYACQGSKPEEAKLLESLERLPSLDVTEVETFSLANDQILISEGSVSLKSIQLLQGFSSVIKIDDQNFCLENPIAEKKYPFAIKQEFELEEMEVLRLLVLSQDKPGLTMLNFIKNVGNAPLNLSFQFGAASELKPSMLMDSTYGVDGADQVIFDELTGVITAKDALNDWYATWASSADYVLKPASIACDAADSTLSKTSGFQVDLMLAPGQEQVVPVYLAGSDQSELMAMETLAELRTDLYSDWDQSYALVDSLLSTSKVTLPSVELQQAYLWSKFKAGVYQFPAEKKETAAIDPDQLLHFYEMNYKGFTASIDQTLFFTDLDQPRHLTPAFKYMQPLVLSLMGIQGDIVNRVTYVRPNLPTEWNEASIENLWIDDNQLDIAITSEENHLTVEITQSQKKAGLSIELPEAFMQVKVLGKEVSNDTKDGFRRILMTGDHVRIEASKK